jgi:ABC-type lipoprotein release transport system permease subunit
LFEVNARSPLALIEAVVITSFVMIVATIIPARSGSRIEPVIALRQA